MGVMGVSRHIAAAARAQTWRDGPDPNPILDPRQPENCSAGGVTWTPAEGGGGGWRNGVSCRAFCFVQEWMLAPKAQEHKIWPEKVFSTNNSPPPPPTFE